MPEFIGYLTDVLAIDLTIGATTLSLGAVSIGVIIIRQGVRFFKSLSSGR